MYSRSIQKLIEILAEFPGVGPKTAARFVFHLLQKSQEQLEDLAKTISSLKTSLKTCYFCFKFFDSNQTGSEENLCEICRDSARDRKLLCVIEKETDLAAIEQAKIYQGLYFVLGGTVSSFKEEELEQLRIKELFGRISQPEKFGLAKTVITEIVLALNPTVEGEATTLYLERKLKELNKKMTRLGRGLPVGAELEYADRETLLSAFKSRS